MISGPDRTPYTVYAFPPQLGGMGGNFPPISGARKMASPHLGGNESQDVFQENPGFWTNLKVLRWETDWKHRKTSIFRRRLRRAVQKKGFKGGLSEILEIFAPIGGKLSPHYFSSRTRWGEIFPPFWEQNANTVPNPSLSSVGANFVPDTTTKTIMTDTHRSKRSVRNAVRIT